MMVLNLMALLLCPLAPLGLADGWQSDCSSGKSNDLKTSALLYAHRCYLKDVPIEIPAPVNTIPDQILPSHIVVQRCSGLCLDSLGSSCLPKKTKVEIHPITVYVNSTPYCSSIELEHHRGPCRCECSLTPASCSSRQHFLSDSCSCQCLPHLARDKLDCLNSTSHTWDSESCQCTCRHLSVCSPGMVFNPATCSCQLAASRQCNHQVGNINTYKVYMMNVILMGVLVVIIISTIYWLLCKDSSRRAQFRYNNNIYRHAREDILQGEENIIIDTSSGSTTGSTGDVNTSKAREEDGEES